MLKKVGKRTKDWNKKRKTLKQLFAEKGITSCELRLHNCWSTYALGFAHRYKRNWYLGDNKKYLGDLNHVILCCNRCHERIENSKELTEQAFKLLRPTPED